MRPLENCTELEVPDPRVLAEFLHVGQDGLRVGLPRAPYLDVQHELGAPPDLLRAQEGANLDVLGVGGGGHEAEDDEGKSARDSRPEPESEEHALAIRG